ncbi:hypothetical protein PYCC9005_003429 [Savitreella phatthalungensis]
MSGAPHLASTPSPGMTSVNGQVPQQTQHPQQQQQQQQQQLNGVQRKQAEHFLRALTEFLKTRGIALPQPVRLHDKSVDLVVLYAHVMKAGGSDAIEKRQLWPQMASAIFLGGMAQEVRDIYMRYIKPYEDAVYESRRKRMLQQQQAQLLQQQQQKSQSSEGSDSSPALQTNGLSQALQGSVPHVPAVKDTSTSQNGSERQHLPPTVVPGQTPSPAILGASRHTSVAPQDANVDSAANVASKVPAPADVSAQPESAPQDPATSNGPPSTAGSGTAATAGATSRPATPMHSKKSASPAVAVTDPGLKTDASPQTHAPLHGPSELIAAAEALVKDELDRFEEEPKTGPRLYMPMKRKIDTVGGLDIDAVARVGHSIDQAKPCPTFQELGCIDVQALTRSLQSGLPAEIANALDILTTIANDRRWSLPLPYCQDLTEALAECLLESAASVLEGVSATDKPIVYSYRQLLKRAKAWAVANRCHQSLDATLEQRAAVERIMAVLTILRNLSFSDINQTVVATSYGFNAALVAAVRIIAPATAALVDPKTMLDLAKDVVTVLALVGMHFQIADAADADIVYTFLLSFRLESHDDPCRFMVSSTQVYDDVYALAALDALAKIAMRNDPNRSLLADIAARNPSVIDRMLTFSLTYLPISAGRETLQIIGERLPSCEHALLVAETAVELMSTTASVGVGEQPQAIAWLLGRDLIYTLRKLLCLLSMQSDQNLAVVVRRLNNILLILAQKVRRSTSENGADLAALEPHSGELLPTKPRHLHAKELLGYTLQNLPNTVIDTLEALHGLSPAAQETASSYASR